MDRGLMGQRILLVEDDLMLGESLQEVSTTIGGDVASWVYVELDTPHADPQRWEQRADLEALLKTALPGYEEIPLRLQDDGKSGDGDPGNEGGEFERHGLTAPVFRAERARGPGLPCSCRSACTS